MSAIARFFEFDRLNTNLRTEVVGGATTFVTMAYIVAVNPGILALAMGQELFGELVFPPADYLLGRYAVKNRWLLPFLYLRYLAVGSRKMFGSRRN